MEARATSFGTIAADYDRYRPGPPADAVRWLVPADARRAVDLASGTGALAAQLAGLVPEVIAVELDRRMLAIALSRSPSAHRVAGAAEYIPLADASADMVGVSSAWHWVDPARALPEVARVLRPGGVLGLMWGGPDRRVDWVAKVLTTTDERSAEDRSEQSRRSDPPVIPTGVPLGQVEQRTFDVSIPYRVEALPGLAATYSRVITLPEAERRAVIKAVADRVATTPELAGRHQIDLPLRCRAIRLSRLP